MLRTCCLLVACFVYFASGAIAVAQGTAKLVIMLDLSGSTSTTATPVDDLAIAREAAKSLLRDFDTQPPERRPYVAIGTFNVSEENAARILPGGDLTNSYGTESPATGLYAIIDGVTTTGGYTDLSAAISVAQAHLQFSSVVGPGYLALISDGTPNRPGTPEYYNCDECGCTASYGATVAAAVASEQNGTTIFAIHYEGHGYPGLCPLEPAKGIAFMSTELVQNPANFFPSNGDLTRVFAQISCAISCDDNDPCTSDSCDTQTGFCIHTPMTADADNDSVPDCRDQCFGDDVLLGTVCQESGTCNAAGTWRCGPQNALLCNSGGVLSPAQCYQCTPNVKSAELNSLLQSAQTLGKSVDSLAKTVRKAFRSKKSVKQFVATSLGNLNLLRADADSLVQSMPDPFLACLNTEACQSITLLPTTLALSQNFEQSLALGKKLSRKGRKASSSQIRAKMKRLYKKAISSKIGAQQILQTLPSVHSVCD